MINRNPKIEKWKPGVPKRFLLFNAGIMWIGAAVVLDGFSYSWLKTEKPSYVFIALLFGFLCALVIHHFGFLRLADKNIERILPMEGSRCFFSFISWKNYILIFVMILLGILLRHSAIPKIYLAVIYTAIGTALFLSSIRYLRYFFISFKNKV